MIKKIDRQTLQQIFINSLSPYYDFKIINGVNPFLVMINDKELYIYIKNLSPAYFSNPDIWRVQLPKKNEFDTIKNSNIDIVLLGYDAENNIYTTWHPKWTKQRLNLGESVSFYSRLSLHKDVSITQEIKRLSLNNDGEVIAFTCKDLGRVLSNLNSYFKSNSDYVALGSKRRHTANDSYKTFCDLKNIQEMSSYMKDNGYTDTIINNYCDAIKSLIKNGYITQHRKIFLACDNCSEYINKLPKFLNQPDIKIENDKYQNNLLDALTIYINTISKKINNNSLSTNSNDSIENKDWETPYINKDGKLTKIMNPKLIETLKPILKTEYLRPLIAYNEIEKFYGNRFSNMDISDWMKLFKNIDW